MDDRGILALLQAMVRAPSHPGVPRQEEAAVRALEDEARRGGNPGECLRSAARAAEEGMNATIPLVARKGRASYLGERSAGHRDPGATSAYLLFEALRDAPHGTRGGKYVAGYYGLNVNRIYGRKTPAQLRGSPSATAAPASTRASGPSGC